MPPARTCCQTRIARTRLTARLVCVRVCRVLRLLQQLPLKLNEVYQESFRATRDKLAETGEGKLWNFNEHKMFVRLDLFCKRCTKLGDLFSTIHQFATLAQQTHIDGLEEIIKAFFAIVDDFKRRPYDLLDYQKSQFDRDLLEFNVSVNEMEGALQSFINASFDSMQSTEHALSLLRQLRAVLQRDALRADLEEKYMVIFQNYGLDLDAVQKTYEKHKHAPPLARNAPPVAGNIAWARQLLRRIEEPMRKFAANSTIMATKEAKRIVKTYNRVAAALVEFEALWHRAWVKSVDTARAGLSATLLARNPETGGLVVNFDREVSQLLRETRCLQAMGVEVPESARMVLLQEEKFKGVHSQLVFVIKEYDRIMAGVLPVARPLLRPHLDELDRRIAPGLTTLTWTSLVRRVRSPRPGWCLPCCILMHHPACADMHSLPPSRASRTSTATCSASTRAWLAWRSWCARSATSLTTASSPTSRPSPPRAWWTCRATSRSRLTTSCRTRARSSSRAPRSWWCATRRCSVRWRTCWSSSAPFRARTRTCR